MTVRGVSAAQFQYTRSVDIPPIQITYEDMDALLSKTYRLAKTANAAYTNADARESVKISFDQQEIKAAGHELPDKNRLPKKFEAIDYDFAVYEAPIASVQVNLSDTYRKVYVSGTSADEVEAVFTQLERGLLEHTVYFSGPKFRMWSSFFLSLGFFLAAMSSVIFGLVYGWKKWPLSFAINFIGLILLCTLPFQQWLPGMAAFKDDVSFVVRRAPEISFVSLIVSLVAIPLSVWLPQITAKKPKSSPASDASNSGAGKTS